jgi:hypothetical protein
MPQEILDRIERVISVFPQDGTVADLKLLAIMLFARSPAGVSLEEFVDAIMDCLKRHGFFLDCKPTLH